MRRAPARVHALTKLFLRLHSGSADFLRLSSSPKMRNYLLLLALLAGARACTPGTTFGSQKCCPEARSRLTTTAESATLAAARSPPPDFPFDTADTSETPVGLAGSLVVAVSLPIVGCALCIGCTIGIWCCIARRTRAPDHGADVSVSPRPRRRWSKATTSRRPPSSSVPRRRREDLSGGALFLGTTRDTEIFPVLDLCVTLKLFRTTPAPHPRARAPPRARRGAAGTGRGTRGGPRPVQNGATRRAARR